MGGKSKHIATWHDETLLEMVTQACIKQQRDMIKMSLMTFSEKVSIAFLGSKTCQRNYWSNAAIRGVVKMLQEKVIES